VYRKLVRLALVHGVTFSLIFTGTPPEAIAQDNEDQPRESILLVAAPHLNDPNFARSVVLVMFPPDSGPSGVILNRPTPMTLRDVWPDQETHQGRADDIYIGGPVQPDGLLILFRMSPPPVRAWQAVDDIYFSGDGDLLKALLLQTKPVRDQRFFAGYAGWAEGQLEWEVSRGDWHILKIDPEILYDTDSETLWERMYQRATLLRAYLHHPQNKHFASH